MECFRGGSVSRSEYASAGSLACLSSCGFRAKSPQVMRRRQYSCLRTRDRRRLELALSETLRDGEKALRPATAP
ncbi:hypothetical protein GCM10027415_02900 [Humibacter ginsengisoli]